MSQTVVCLPAQSYFITVDTDDRLVLLGDRLTGCVPGDATAVRVWAATRPLFLLPSRDFPGLAPAQFADACSQFGCDALLANQRLVVGADADDLGLVQLREFRPAEFRRFRKLFRNHPVTTQVSYSRA